MAATLADSTLTKPTAEEISAFERDGFHLARALLPSGDIGRLRDHFIGLHARAPIFSVYTAEPDAADPNRRFPRIMHPHRWDETARRWLLDPRITGTLRELIGDEPLAAQSMFYFKPPGGDGQGFHQDNYYLMARPGTCYAAWLAVDDADAGNGSLFVLPGSQHAILDPRLLDHNGNLKQSPALDRFVSVSLRAGDCLFFHGALIHGSQRNASSERWRRSFICHFVGRASCERMAAYCHPIFAADGSVAPMGTVFDMPPGPNAA